MRQIEVIDSQRMKIMDKLRFHCTIVDTLSDGVATSALSNIMQIISVGIYVTYFFFVIFVERLHWKDE